MEISIEEWQAELDRLAAADNDKGMTSKEIQEALKLSDKKTQIFLRSGVTKGTIKVGKRKIERDWDGRSRTYTVYMVTK